MWTKRIFITIVVLLLSQLPSVSADSEDPTEAPPEVVSLEVVARLPGGCGFTEVVTRGDYIYAGCKGVESRLHVLDVSDPDQLVLVAQSAQLAGRVSTLVLAGDLVYAGMGDTGLSIIDVSDPAQPEEIGELGIMVRDMAYANSTIYATNDGVLQIVDVSAPQQPEVVGQFQFGNDNSVDKIAVEGNYVYILADNNDLKIVDVNDNTAPAQVGQFIFYPSPNRYKATVHDVAVTDNRAYVSWNDIFCISYGCVYHTFVEILDVEDPSNPIQVDTIPSGAYDGGIYDLTFVDEYLIGLAVSAYSSPYVHPCDRAGRSDFLSIIDLSNLESEWMRLSVGASGIAITGGYAHVAGWDQGLATIDMKLGDSSPPETIGRYGGFSGITELIPVEGDYLYAWQGDLSVIDIRKPVSPTLLAQYDADDALRAVVSGDYLFAVNHKLDILNVAEPAQPQSMGSQEMESVITDIEVREDFAYLATGKRCEGPKGLGIVDVSEPDSPQLTSYLNLADGESYEFWASALAMSGKYVYFSRRDNLVVVDVNDPLHPVAVNTIEKPSGSYPSIIQSLAIVDHYLYATLSGPRSKLWILDISDFVHPQEVAILDGSWFGSDFIRSWGYAFSAVGDLTVFDVRNPIQPQIVTSFDTPGSSKSVVQVGDYLYTDDGYGGISVLHIKWPDRDYYYLPLFFK